MPPNIEQSARQQDESDTFRIWPSSHAQGFGYEERRSSGRRPFRALFRYIVAVLIGVGLTLTWQSYGNEGVEMARSYAPSLAWLLPVPVSKTPPNKQMSAAEIATEVKQQLEPIALKVDVVQHSIVQLAAKINELAANQVTQNIQSVGQDISQTTSSLPRGTNPTQTPERGTKLEKPDMAANAGAAPNAADTAETRQPASNKCNIDTCKKTFLTFNPADCTYQPLEGPRRLCTK
jgi:hypothetical protein